MGEVIYTFRPRRLAQLYMEHLEEENLQRDEKWIYLNVLDEYRIEFFDYFKELKQLKALRDGPMGDRPA